MTLKELKEIASKKIIETEDSIKKFRELVRHTEEQVNVLSILESNEAERAHRKLEIELMSGIEFLHAEFDADKELLISILKKNIEDNTKLIHELAKELGIEVK